MVLNIFTKLYNHHYNLIPEHFLIWKRNLVSISSYSPFFLGFPDSSAGKESAGNVGELGVIPGLGRSPGKGIGYPLQYSWASLVAYLEKNPPAKWETWIWSLGWEDPLEMGKAIHSSILAWRIQWTVHGVTKSQTQLSNFHFHSF